LFFIGLTLSSKFYNIPTDTDEGRHLLPQKQTLLQRFEAQEMQLNNDIMQLEKEL
jgi:hypothetical protein